MVETLNMPKLGFDMAEGTLVNWTKAVGDQVNKGDVIAEIETDKATIEIEAQASGTILKLLAELGDVVAVGAPIAYVGEAKASRSPKTVTACRRRMAPAPSKAGSGATAAPAKEAAPGTVQDKDEGESRPQPAEGLAEGRPAAGEAVAEGNGHFIKASPIARRIADERGIDLRQVKGTGWRWIVKRDASRTSSPQRRPRRLAEARAGSCRAGRAARPEHWRAAIRPGRRGDRHQPPAPAAHGQRMSRASCTSRTSTSRRRST